VHELGSQWDEPDLVVREGRVSITLTTNNEGWNLYRPKQVTKRFVFEKGAPVLVEETHAREIEALANIRSEQFEGRAPDDAVVLSFDLDADGKPDEISATLWERWGRLFWRVRFADGTESGDSGHNCKRLGVLPELTLGRHDLVCDFDTRLKWDGKQYVAEQE